MENWLQQTLLTLTHSTSYYFLIAAIACGEGIALVGLIIPGSVLCISVGLLAANGHGDFWLSCLAASIGAIIGDLISYLTGSRSGHQLVNRTHSTRALKILRRAELFFAAHGGKSLLFARFFGPLRGFVPFIAGSLRLSPKTVLFYSISGGILWGIGYPALGYYGGLTWQQFHLSAYSVVGMIGIIVAVVFLFWAWRSQSKSR
jgi:membrane protein DedA with SNARE-associated domain